ncbi:MULTISPECIES: hypothetical protein [Paraburkholderia]|uniref:Uncharacterized protein n=1 Tax=Paraburkholderia youngii TaxID=2782701 RepID=A0A7Y6JYB3_9BURK|nr:hypothetical protein [Paraburkholderia youngii]NUY00426.1 hypothetical protein [Paraburkholderia youngii]
MSTQITMRSTAIHRSAMFVALLLCSLTSHGPYVVMTGILLLMAVCMSDAKVREALFSIRCVALVSLSATVITACYLWFLAVPHGNASYNLEKSATNNYIFFLLDIGFLASFAALISTRIGEVTTAVSRLLVLNCSVLFLQTATLLISGQYIDFTRPITGDASRYQNWESVHPVFAFRPTGLYIEPSTFAAAVGTMAIGYILLSRARGKTPATLPIALTVLSMLITQSAAAVVQAVVLIAALMVTHSRRMRAWATAIFTLIALASPGLIAAYVNSFMLKIDADSGLRLRLLSYVYEVRHGWDFLFGYGPFSVEYDLFDVSEHTSTFVASLNDAGLLNFFVVQLGIVGLAIPIGIFLVMKKDIANLCFFGLLMSSKLSYTSPLLYFGLLPLVMRLGVSRDNTHSAAGYRGVDVEGREPDLLVAPRSP